MSESIFEYPDACGPQLIPSTAWNSNLRAILSKKEWNELRQRVFNKHGKVCAYCEAKPKVLDCHEIWKYTIYPDGFTKQSLVKILPLCKACHMVCHIGFWSLKGKFDQVLSHMMKVRSFSRAEALNEIAQADKKFQILSQYTWELDIAEVNSYV